MPLQPDRRLIAGLGLGLVVLAAVLAGGLLLALFRWYAPVEFPGSTLTSDRTVLTPGLHPVIRRDMTYESSAPFGEAYKWYSITYGLGPEIYGQGTCSLMARSTTTWRIVDQDTSIQVCDTPTGRMILVMRSLALRLR